MKSEKRTNMKPEERRRQLVDCAQELFFSKGFEETSMTEILEAAGISKGGFYHHFKSKDELLFAVLENLTAQIAVAITAIVQDESTSPKDRMLTILSMEGAFFKEANFAAQLEMIGVMNQDKNLGLSNRLNRMIHDVTAPIFADIIREGQKDGSLAVSDADAAASLIIYLGRWYHTALTDTYRARHTDGAEKAANHLQAVLKQQFVTIDSILGLPPGTADFGWPEMVQTILSLPAEPQE